MPRSFTILSCEKNLVCFLTETWLTASHAPKLDELTPPNYKISHLDRMGGRGGGIATIYKESFIVNDISTPVMLSSAELQLIKIQFAPTLSFTVALMYRPPHTLSHFLGDFTELCDFLVTQGQKIIILGDFNFHFDDLLDPPTSRFIEILNNFNLTTLIKEPTHRLGHIIDQICMNFNNVKLESQYFTPWSDHIFLAFLIPAIAQKQGSLITTQSSMQISRCPLHRIDTATLETMFRAQLPQQNKDGSSFLSVESFNDALLQSLNALAPTPNKF